MVSISMALLSFLDRNDSSSSSSSSNTVRPAVEDEGDDVKELLKDHFFLAGERGGQVGSHSVRKSRESASSNGDGDIVVNGRSGERRKWYVSLAKILTSS